MRIQLHPERLPHFGEPEGAAFCLVTNARLVDAFEIGPAPGYAEVRVLAFEPGDDFDRLLAESVPRPAHVLVVAPDCYFRSPGPEALGDRCKLSVMACNSTPASPEVIQHFLRVGEQTDPAGQAALADRFFDAAERAEQLVFEDQALGTRAVFAHREGELQWHEQVGPLDWGGQQLFPPGEVSVLPVGLYGAGMAESLPLEGTLGLRGKPVLHSGTPSFLPEDQARHFASLCALEHAAVVATVEAGRITGLAPSGPEAKPALETLEALLAVDSRYRLVVEIGLSVHLASTPFPGNAAMNEVVGGRRGTVHWGLGLIPYTQYHLDVLCPDTRVVDEAGRPVFAADGTAGARPRLRRSRTAVCPCIDPGAGQ